MSRSIGLTLLALQLVASSCWTSAWAQHRDWETATTYAIEITNRQFAISASELVDKLLEIKELLQGMVVRDVPTKVRTESRASLLDALSLLRLTEATWEKCLTPNVIITDGNYHRGNYIELEQVLKSNYKSPGILALIDTYFETMFFVCRNALVAHFGMKVSKVNNDNKGNFESFLQKFPPFPAGQAADSRQPVNSQLISHFISNFYRLGYDNHATTMEETIFDPYFADQIFDDCSLYLLTPFKTLVMTYDRIERKLPDIETRYGNIVRAYDICKRWIEYPEERKMKILNLALNQANQPAPLAPLASLPPIDARTRVRGQRPSEADEQQQQQQQMIRPPLPAPQSNIGPFTSLMGQLNASSGFKRYKPTVTDASPSSSSRIIPSSMQIPSPLEGMAPNPFIRRVPITQVVQPNQSGPDETQAPEVDRSSQSEPGPSDRGDAGEEGAPKDWLNLGL